jgi:hypothetical protein
MTTFPAATRECVSATARQRPDARQSGVPEALNFGQMNRFKGLGSELTRSKALTQEIATPSRPWLRNDCRSTENPWNLNETDAARPAFQPAQATPGCAASAMHGHRYTGAVPLGTSTQSPT